MRKFLCTILLAVTGFYAKSQSADSTSLKEVVVKAYFSEQPILKSPASVSIIGPDVLENHVPFSLVPAINTMPGVRMEERSPGSYRLSIRGSLLRSPFGIRNVKIYLEDFMLTDAGGNTYLNLLDAGSSSEIEVLKGPEGSIYGANSGGVILLRQHSPDSSMINASITGGSYGLFHEKFEIKKNWGDFQLGINQAYQRSDGYRNNSGMARTYIHLMPEWKYINSGKIKGLFLFSDLDYQTPGGLTQTEWEIDPQASRPTAIERKASIYNKTYLAGISHDLDIAKNLRHVISVTGSRTDFTNPTFRNYELRDERSLGLRTFFEWTAAEIAAPFKVQVGFESQQTSLDVERNENNSGQRGELQQSDFLKARQGFVFAHFSINPIQNFTFESALSLNRYSYSYENYFPNLMQLRERNFKKQLMPRFAASYLVNKSVAVRASVSRGYSPPTLEEVNPSQDNPSSQVINTTIEAEKGWNHEAGVRISLFNNQLYWDAVYFHYVLKDAIVAGLKVNEADYYINAGSTRQNGLESELVALLIPRRVNGFIRSLQLRNSFSYSHFRFGSYINQTNDFSGNELTGVPEKVVITSLETGLPRGFNLFFQHNYTSSLPLNDANTFYTANYHLLNLKASWNTKPYGNNFRFFAGLDNLLNEKYSLGNDLNAFGGRYYNAAPERNFYLGIAAKL